MDILHAESINIVLKKLYRKKCIISCISYKRNKDMYSVLCFYSCFCLLIRFFQKQNINIDNKYKKKSCSKFQLFYKQLRSKIWKRNLYWFSIFSFTFLYKILLTVCQTLQKYFKNGFLIINYGFLIIFNNIHSKTV